MIILVQTRQITNILIISNATLSITTSNVVGLRLILQYSRCTILKMNIKRKPVSLRTIQL